MTTLSALGLACLAGPAFATINWAPPGVSTSFQDDDLDFVYSVTKPSDDPTTWSLTPKPIVADAQLEVGDVLVAVFEFPEAGGDPVAPQQLSGVSVIEVKSFDAATRTLVFQPYQGGMNDAITQLLGSDYDIGASGDAGGGAMIAIHLGDANVLDIDASGITQGNLSCSSMQTCLKQAVTNNAVAPGDLELLPLFEIDGIDLASDPDSFWESTIRLGPTSGPNADPDKYVDLLNVQDADIATPIGDYNAGLEILVNNTGQRLKKNAYDATGGTGAGDGKVDMIVSGSLKGPGGATMRTNYPGLAADSLLATSDIDLSKTIPVPGTLALLGVGLFGLGRIARSRVEA